MLLRLMSNKLHYLCYYTDRNCLGLRVWMVLLQRTGVAQSVCPCVDLLTARQTWIVVRGRSLVYIDQLPNSSLVKTMVKHSFLLVTNMHSGGFHKIKLITDIDICNLRLGARQGTLSGRKRF